MSSDAFQPILLQLPSFTPSLAVEVLPYGATLHRLFVQADGRTHDILIGPEKPEDHVTQKYTNSIVGRYANRLPVTASPVTLSRHGLISTFSAQPNERPEVSLHGGPVGFDSVAWTPLVELGQSKLFTSEEIATLQAELPAATILERVSPDGEQGFPGTLRVEFLVGLIPPQGSTNVSEGQQYPLGSLVLVYRARLEQEGKVTPINLTQHWGFNLDASLKDLPDRLSVLNHKLSVKADNTIALTEVGLSTGNLAPVKGTVHAHSEKATSKIGENYPATGYDDFYLLSRSVPAIPTRLPTSGAPNVVKSILETTVTEPLVTLESDGSGIKIAFDSNQSGVQFYTNNFSDPAKTARKKIHGGSGKFGDGYNPGAAAFLEFHEPLEAWHNPETLGVSKDDTLLASDEVYNNYVRVDVLYHTPMQA